MAKSILIGQSVKFKLTPKDTIVGVVAAVGNGQCSVRGISRTNKDGEQPCPPNDFYGVPLKGVEAVAGSGGNDEDDE